MKNMHSLPRRRNAFTLIELLVVMVLILVLAALGLGYVVFGQDNQHSVSGAQAVTGALLNAKQRARRDGLPTGIRILFGTPGLTPPLGPFPTEAGQLELVQQPQDYNAGTWSSVDPTGTVLGFSGATDFLGGADYIGQIDQSTVQAGDYFLVFGTTTPHRILQVNSPQSLTLVSSVLPFQANLPYTIIRAPRRLPSEDIIQLPSTVVIDNTVATAPGTPANQVFTYCQNLPLRYLVDSMTPPPPPNTPAGTPVAEIIFAPSGAVIGQGTGNDKVSLWLRDPNPKLTPIVGAPVPGAPLILSVQFRTGFIGVFPVAPWAVGTAKSAGNDPFAYVQDPRSSGL